MLDIIIGYCRGCLLALARFLMSFLSIYLGVLSIGCFTVILGGPLVAEACSCSGLSLGPKVNFLIRPIAWTVSSGFDS